MTARSAHVTVGIQHALGTNWSTGTVEPSPADFSGPTLPPTTPELIVAYLRRLQGHEVFQDSGLHCSFDVDTVTLHTRACDVDGVPRRSTTSQASVARRASAAT